MPFQHVVIPRIATKRDHEVAVRKITERWTRVRHISTMRQLDKIGLSWIYVYDEEDRAIYASKVFEQSEQRTVESVFSSITMSGLDDSFIGRSAMFPKKAFLGFIASRTEMDNAVMKVIERRAARLTGYVEKRTSKIDDAESERLAQASGLLSVVGPKTSDCVDRLWSEIHEQAPWLSNATSAMWRSMRGSVIDGRGPILSPTLVWGAPGIGKTTLPRMIAEATGAPIIEIDAGLSSAAFRVAGLDHGWGGSHAGDPITAIIEHRIANPIIVVNEIDRIGGGMSRAGGSVSSMTDALLTMLDRGSAARFRCPYFRKQFDMSRATWILTANDLDAVDPVLLTRVQRFEIQRPDPDHVSDIVRRGLSCVDDEMADWCAEVVADKWRNDQRMTLRQVSSLIDRIRSAESGPRLH